MDNAMTVDAQVINKKMQEQFIINAKTKPWGWEWKYTMAFKMLREGSDIAHVKKTLGLTYAWMIRRKLIEWMELRDKDNHVVDRRLAVYSKI